LREETEGGPPVNDRRGRKGNVAVKVYRNGNGAIPARCWQSQNWRRFSPRIAKNRFRKRKIASRRQAATFT
jgi:hypothetical protein